MPARRMLALTLLGWLWSFSVVLGGRQAGYEAAVESITASDLAQFVACLADTSMDGREAGSPGGHVAGDFLAAQLATLHLQPAGTRDPVGAQASFFQTFGANCRNVLAILPGSDLALKAQYVLVGAHYDHLGHGLRQPGRDASPGPVYPGADDNASGVSGVLEVARAMTLLPESPKRTILLVFWDGEEKGLLGSKHWAAHPTIPIARVVAALNVDMIGGLRNSSLTLLGSRTGYGLRQFACEENREAGLAIDFPWTLLANADHHSLATHQIPVLMFHTGMHETYHQPSDDAAHVDPEGMKRVTRLLFAMVFDLANRAAPPRFRSLAIQEGDEARHKMEQPDPWVMSPGDPPVRLGIAWKADEAEPGTILISHVVAGSAAAAAGLRVGDRICRIAGREFPDDEAFAKLARTLPSPLELLAERAGQFRTVVVRFGDSTP
jgi:hypothetical protein